MYTNHFYGIIHVKRSLRISLNQFFPINVYMLVKGLNEFYGNIV